MATNTVTLPAEHIAAARAAYTIAEAEMRNLRAHLARFDDPHVQDDLAAIAFQVRRSQRIVEAVQAEANEHMRLARVTQLKSVS